MEILSITQIMEAKDTTEKVVDIPEWGGSVVVKSISHRTMRDIKKSLDIENEDDVDEDELEKWIFIKGMVNPSISEEEYEHILEKSTGAVTKILTEILGRSKNEESAVVEAEKNFPAGPDGVSPVPSGGDSGDDSGKTVDRKRKSA